MTVFEQLTLSAVRNDNTMSRNKFLFFFTNAQPGIHNASNTQGLPGGCSRLELTRK